VELVTSKVSDKIMKKLLLAKLLAWPRGLIVNLLSRVYLVVVSYQDPHRAKIIDLVRKIKQERETFMFYNEACQIFTTVRQVKKIEGDLAEVGAYKGGSTKIICEAKGDRPLHVFDTFEGLPRVKRIDQPLHQKQFSNTSLKNVKNYLKKYPHLHFYKGVFPKTAAPIKNKSFSFVNLDVDIYESTLNCLKFFYPRMNKGGIIISHDYSIAAGVKKAFNEFFKNKREPIIELSGTQCLVVKL